MIDFIDLGCGSGGSIDWAKRKFNGGTHLGIEKYVVPYEKAVKNGYNVIQKDVVLDDTILPKCRFVTMLHFLEHLRNEDEVKKVILKSIDSATDFIFFKVPYFDADEYLKSLDFKFTWSDWIGHPTAITTTLIKRLLDENVLQYEIGYSHPVLNSDSNEIIPFSSPVDTIKYDTSLGIKKYVKLNNVFRETYCFVNINCPYWNELIRTNL